MPATSRAHASELGLRTRIAACESSVGEHLFPVSGKAENMKLRKIMDVGEDSVKKTRWSGQPLRLQDQNPVQDFSRRGPSTLNQCDGVLFKLAVVATRELASIGFHLLPFYFRSPVRKIEETSSCRDFQSQ
jgi:hypothetical protein